MDYFNSMGNFTSRRYMGPDFTAQEVRERVLVHAPDLSEENVKEVIWRVTGTVGAAAAYYGRAEHLDDAIEEVVMLIRYMNEGMTEKEASQRVLDEAEEQRLDGLEARDFEDAAYGPRNNDE